MTDPDRIGHFGPALTLRREADGSGSDTHPDPRDRRRHVKRPAVCCSLKWKVEEEQRSGGDRGRAAASGGGGDGGGIARPRRRVQGEGGAVSGEGDAVRGHGLRGGGNRRIHLRLRHRHLR